MCIFIAEGGADPPLAPSTSSRHGERCVQQHPGSYQNLPGFRRQVQGYFPRVQEQASRLPFALQQARLRGVSRQGPAVIYTEQRRHMNA